MSNTARAHKPPRTNQDRAAQEREVRHNARIFDKLLPQLLEQNLKGYYALMHKGKIEATLKDFNDAMIMGNRVFGGKPFSVQPITDESANLGFYSYR